MHLFEKKNQPLRFSKVYSILQSFIKVKIFWVDHKNLKKSPNLSKKLEFFFQMFVAFSEYLIFNNFVSPLLITVMVIVVQPKMIPNQNEYQEQNPGGMNPIFMSIQEIGQEWPHISCLIRLYPNKKILTITLLVI